MRISNLSKNKFFILSDLLLGIFLTFLIFNLYANESADSRVIYEKTARNIYEACQNSSNKEPCYIKQFDNITKKYGLIFSEKTLYALQDLDPSLRHCHVLSHKIATSATRANPKDWKKLIIQADLQTCGGGFLHGILEAHIGDNSNFHLDSQSIVDLCGQDHRVFQDRTCTHILGHLVLFQEQGNVEKSVSICEKIKNPTLSQECFTGVFMEDSFKTTLADHGLAEIPVRDKSRMDRQKQRCLKYDGIAANACWIDMAEIFSEFYNYDPEKVYNSCYFAPTETSGEKCYMKASILMAVSPNYDSSENMVKICKPYEDKPEKFNQCIYFAISALTHYSVNFIPRGVMMCSNIIGSERENCFKELSKQLKTIETVKYNRTRWCSGAPKEYFEICAS